MQQIPCLQESESEDNFKETVPKAVNETKTRCNWRLKQYSSEEVSEAIETARSRFLDKTECPKCNFVGSNLRALTIHVSHVHK